MIIVRVDFKHTPWGGLGVQYLTKPHTEKGFNPITQQETEREDVWTPKERQALRFKTEDEARAKLIELTHWAPHAKIHHGVEYVTLGVRPRGESIRAPKPAPRRQLAKPKGVSKVRKAKDSGAVRLHNGGKRG